LCRSYTAGMNARIQRWQLLLRAILALATLISCWRSGAPWLGLLLAAAVFWLYGLGMLMMFAWLPRLNTGQPPSGRLQLLRAWWHELIVCERVFAWQQPFAAQRHADFLPSSRAVSRGQRGVLLLHGFACNRGVWNSWMGPLRARGHPHIALTLEPVYGAIDAYVAQIEAAVQTLEQRCGQPPVIVAHSMGGLAARAWWRRHGQAGRIHRCLTLGTPHAGTLMARFGMAVNARQMRRQSRWLSELAAHEAATRSAQQSQDFAGRFDCYFSRCDQIVCPADTAVLPGSQAIEVVGSGHLALVFQPRILADLLRLLEEKST
jgi:triacylglycerol lipase